VVEVTVRLLLDAPPPVVVTEPLTTIRLLGPVVGVLAQAGTVKEPAASAMRNAFVVIV
jgi:hypothetical protein